MSIWKCSRTLRASTRGWVGLCSMQSSTLLHTNTLSMDLKNHSDYIEINLFKLYLRVFFAANVTSRVVSTSPDARTPTSWTALRIPSSASDFNLCVGKSVHAPPFSWSSRAELEARTTLWINSETTAERCSRVGITDNSRRSLEDITRNAALNRNKSPPNRLDEAI